MRVHDAAVIYKQLDDFRAGKRSWGAMNGIAQALSPQASADVAVYFARRTGGLGTFFRGWALAEDGRLEERIAQMHAGMAAFQATGSKMFIPFYLAMIAQASGQIGRAEQGLVLLAQALATVERTEERHWEAELYRLKGELTLQSKVQGANSPMESEAEECFRKAIDIAQKQRAKSLELRATMSLARLLENQGCCNEARTMLAEVYNWFTEGFDTADLKDAQALLDKLSAQAVTGEICAVRNAGVTTQPKRGSAVTVAPH